MAQPSFPIPICFTTLLSQIIEKVEVNRQSCSYRIQQYGFYRAYNEIQVLEHKEHHTFQGRVSPRKHYSMQSATKSAILHLKDIFNFEVQDINMSDMHYYHWCYNELQKYYNTLLQENHMLKSQLANYEHFGTVKDETASYTSHNF